MQTLTPMTADRRALHRIPELGDELPKTMDYLQNVLGTLGRGDVHRRGALHTFLLRRLRP